VCPSSSGRIPMLVKGPIFCFARMLPTIRMKFAALVIAQTFVALLLVSAQESGRQRDRRPPANPAVDPGPRGAPIGAGGPIANLTADQLRFFNDAARRFVNAEGVGDQCGFLWDLSFPTGHRRQQSEREGLSERGPESPGCARHRERRTKQASILRHSRWPRAGGSLQVHAKPRWDGESQ
jgi:hypothetical protein